jgi:hypothetical protein
LLRRPTVQLAPVQRSKDGLKAGGQPLTCDDCRTDLPGEIIQMSILLP